MVLAAAAFAAVMPFLVPLSRGLHGAAAREATGVARGHRRGGIRGRARVRPRLVRDLARPRRPAASASIFSRPISGSALWAGKLGARLAPRARGRRPSSGCRPGWRAAGRRVLVDLPRVVGAGRCSAARRDPRRSGPRRGHRAALAVGAPAVDFTVLVLVGRARDLVRALPPAAVRDVAAPRRTGRSLAAMLVLGTPRGRSRRDHARPQPTSAPRTARSRLGSGRASPAGLAVYGGLAAWVLSAATGRSVSRGVLPAPAESWIAVSGQRPRRAGRIPDGYRVRPVSAGAVRSARAHAWEGPSFSADGRTAAWFEPAEFGAPYELVTARSRSARVRVRSARDSRRRSSRQSRSCRPTAGASPFSASGPRRSRRHRERTAPRLRPPVRRSRRTRRALSRTRSLPRGRSGDRGSLDLFDLDIPSRRLAPRATISGSRGLVHVRGRSVRGSGCIVREKAGKRVRLFDARNGDPIATLAEGPPQDSSWAFFLADGRIGYLTSADGRGRLRVFSADGAPLQGRSKLPEIIFVRGARSRPGKSSSRCGRRPGKLVLYLADLDAGTVRRVADGLLSRPLVRHVVEARRSRIRRDEALLLDETKPRRPRPLRSPDRRPARDPEGPQGRLRPATAAVCYRSRRRDDGILPKRRRPDLRRRAAVGDRAQLRHAALRLQLGLDRREPSAASTRRSRRCRTSSATRRRPTRASRSSRRLAALGAGADVVSGGELRAALECGIPADRIVFSGVGKTEDEIARRRRGGHPRLQRGVRAGDREDRRDRARGGHGRPRRAARQPGHRRAVAPLHLDGPEAEQVRRGHRARRRDLREGAPPARTSG